MKLDNIRNFPTIDAYVTDKLERYAATSHNMEALYSYMFDETDNVMTETTDGYRIRKTTYGEAKLRIESVTRSLREALGNIPAGSLVGLYAGSTPDFITVFWAILGCGFSVLLMNTRLPSSVLEQVIADRNVAAVVSDSTVFPVKTIRFSELLSCPAEPLRDEMTRSFGQEVTFMSSGTSETVKLCTFTGESFYQQVKESVDIIHGCPAIKEHYEGQLKHLVLLPFCHVFGFIAVYLWFGFFGRTFVFPKDLNPATVQNTIRKHKVTHVFAVPMVWEAVHKAAVRKIQTRGDKTYRKFIRAVTLVNRMGRLGDTVARKALRDVRDALFGDSIRFLISGGSHISSETMAFFNGIGYHLANGYGMTELGITSVERSSVRSILNTTSVGSPFGGTEYRISPDGELMVRSATRAVRISVGRKDTETNLLEWFPTGDLAEERNHRYFIKGRRDDLLIGLDGENINPVLVESSIAVRGAEQVCLLQVEGEVLLLASVPGIYSAEVLHRIHRELASSLEPLKLSRTVRKILLTDQPLLASGEIKLSRKRLSRALKAGELSVFDATGIVKRTEERLSALEAEVRECFAIALSRPASDIPTDAHFFNELGGTSLEYFSLLGELKTRFALDAASSGENALFTVRDFTEIIRSNHT